MPEDKNRYGLARFNSDDSVFKRARKAAATDADNLQMKRIEFARERERLQGIIRKIVELNKKQADSPEERQKKELEISQYYTIASLKGLSGLYDGLGLISDMTAVAMRDKNPDTGEKVHYRLSSAEMLYDACGMLYRISKSLKKQNKILMDIGKKQGALWEGRYADEADEADSGEDEIEQTAPLGVTDEQIKEKLTVTDEEIERELKG